MINYYFPGFYENQPLYNNYLTLYNNFKEVFYDDVHLKYIYGNFPSCIWNGGTVFLATDGCKFATTTVIDKTFEWYFKNNLKLQLTFTNPSLQETDIYDRYANIILDKASHYPNIEILISSPILEKYIRQKYPNIIIDKSIVGVTEIRESYSLKNIEEDLKKYHIIVIPRKYVKNFKFLASIPKEYRNRIEILANDPCFIDCPRLYSHYVDFSKVQLYERDPGTPCTNGDKIINPLTYYNTREGIYDIKDLQKISKAGFTEIKIAGRLFPVNTILLTYSYLIKPEYHLDVLQYLFKPFKNIYYSSMSF